MEKNQMHMYDSAYAAFHAGWGLTRSILGLIGALSLGVVIGFTYPFRAGSFSWMFTAEVVSLPYFGMLYLFTGPLVLIIAPFFVFSIIWCVLLDRPPLIVVTNLFLLQVVNTSMKFKGDEGLIAAVIGTLAVGNLAVFFIWAWRWRKWG